MSIDYSYYIGPYVKVPKFDIETSYTIVTCPSKKCRNHGNTLSGYCSACGLKTESVTIEKTVKSSSMSIRYEMVKALNIDVDLFGGFGCWLSEEGDFNYLFKNAYKIKGEEVPGKYYTVGEVQRITPNIIEKEIETFSRLFSEQIEYLQQNHPGTIVEWGAFVNAS